MNYKKNYLTDIVLRVDFAAVEETIKCGLNTVVTEKCLKDFPIQEVKEIEKNEVVINSGTKLTETVKSEKMKEWHFWGINREKQLVIASNCFILVFKTYSCFDDLKQTFLNVFNSFCEYYPNVKIHRIGLRYVNQVNMPSEKTDRKTWYDFWNKYFSLSLTNGLQIVDDDEALSRYITSVEMNYGKFMLRCQYGILNPDYPAINKRQSFLFDTDVYAVGLYELCEISDIIDEFHQKSNKWFENSIKTALRKKMEIISDE